MFSRLMSSWSTASLGIAVCLTATLPIVLNAGDHVRLEGSVLEQSRGGSQDRNLMQKSCSDTISPCFNPGQECISCSQPKFTSLGPLTGGGFGLLPLGTACGNATDGLCNGAGVCDPVGDPSGTCTAYEQAYNQTAR